MDSGFEYMNVLSCVYNEIEYLYQRFNKKLNRVQLLSPAECMLITKVSDDACQWNGHDVVISIDGNFFLQNALYVAWHTKKSWAFSIKNLVVAISAALHEMFVCHKYANSVSQFLL